MILKGFESGRFQKHDTHIREQVLAFNLDMPGFCGCTPEQAATMPCLLPLVVKSWVIQESGGGNARSLAAWEVDPFQVNVPGDWSDYKEDLGLRKPTSRNEGTLQTNIRAGIAWMVRKGFGVSGQPPANRPEGTFDGYETALRRYNGRTDSVVGGKTYSQRYAERIMARATNPGVHHPIELG